MASLAAGKVSRESVPPETERPETSSDVRFSNPGASRPVAPLVVVVVAAAVVVFAVFCVAVVGGGFFESVPGGVVSVFAPLPIVSPSPPTRKPNSSRPSSTSRATSCAATSCATFAPDSRRPGAVATKSAGRGPSYTISVRQSKSDSKMG